MIRLCDLCLRIFGNYRKYVEKYEFLNVRNQDNESIHFTVTAHTGKIQNLVALFVALSTCIGRMDGCCQ